MCSALSLSIARLAHFTLLRAGTGKEQLPQAYAITPIGEVPGMLFNTNKQPWYSQR